MRKPIPNSNRPIVELVIEDLEGRARLGLAKYGTKLQAHNGRVALQDLYEELLDAAQYVRQELEERPPARDVAIAYIEGEIEELEACVEDACRGWQDFAEEAAALGVLRAALEVIK